MHDLGIGEILHLKDHVTAEAAPEFCSKEPQFAKVPFEQFEARLRDHRDQAKENWLRSATEEMAMVRNRRLHPRKTHNDKGTKCLTCLKPSFC